MLSPTNDRKLSCLKREYNPEGEKEEKKKRDKDRNGV